MLHGVAAMVTPLDQPAKQHLTQALTQDQRMGLVEALEQGFAQGTDAPDADWLTRIEGAQLRYPGDPMLQYLAGMTCMHLKLWGKAQQLLTQSLPQLRSAKLARSAWLTLAALAEQRDDAPAATQALKKALSSV